MPLRFLLIVRYILILLVYLIRLLIGVLLRFLYMARMIILNQLDMSRMAMVLVFLVKNLMCLTVKQFRVLFFIAPALLFLILVNGNPKYLFRQVRIYKLMVFMHLGM